MRKDKESMSSIKSLEACDVQAKCISHEMHCSRHIDYSVKICRFSISSLKQMFLCVENWGLETLEYKVADPSGELPRAHSHAFHVPQSRCICEKMGAFCSHFTGKLAEPGMNSS